MSDTLTVLYVESVGQAVAAVTRSGSDELDAGAIAGEAFPLRMSNGSGLVDVELPVAELSTAQVDAGPDVLRQPTGYRVADGSAEIIDATKTTSFDAASRTVTIGANATEELDVWAVVQDDQGSAPLVATSTIPIGVSTSPALFSPLAPGVHRVMAAVTQHLPHVEQFSV